MGLIINLKVHSLTLEPLSISLFPHGEGIGIISFFSGSQGGFFFPQGDGLSRSNQSYVLLNNFYSVFFFSSLEVSLVFIMYNLFHILFDLLIDYNYIYFFIFI